VTNVNVLDERAAVVCEIEVTPEMVQASLAELREHHYDVDIGGILESVFNRLLKNAPWILGFVIHSICGFGVICDART
jgi:hypothetical protein